MALLRDALPRAGELAAALRLEGGAIALERGETPWPWVGELTRSAAPAAHRRAAGELLRRSWQRLPIAVVSRQQHSLVLPRALRRDLAATLGARTSDVAAAIRLLREGRSDEPAARTALWLASQPGLTAGVRLHVGEALLAAGWWSEAETVLAAPVDGLPAHLRGRLAYLRGRAAYRRGKLGDAAPLFDRALELAASDEERFDAAVQRARVAERTGDLPGAVPLWDAARHARPQEVEGWDGGARARAVLGRSGEAAGLLAKAPPKVLRVAGPRLAAVLLAHGDLEQAGALLARLPQRLPARQALAVALAARRGDTAAARSGVRSILADRSAGAWRSLVLDVLPGPPAAPAGRRAVLARGERPRRHRRRPRGRSRAGTFRRGARRRSALERAARRRRDARTGVDRARAGARRGRAGGGGRGAVRPSASRRARRRSWRGAPRRSPPGATARPRWRPESACCRRSTIRPRSSCRRRCCVASYPTPSPRGAAPPPAPPMCRRRGSPRSSGANRASTSPRARAPARSASPR